MPTITQITFYFAIQQQDDNGNLLTDQPPEAHTLTLQQVIDNVGFSLSTGESMFTELLTDDYHSIRVVNGFYFGTGVYGSLLGIQYHYDDGSDGWIDIISYRSENSQNLDMIIGNWIKGKTYEQVVSDPNWLGTPYIGFENDYTDLTVTRIEPPIEEEPTDPPPEEEEPTEPLPEEPIEPTDPPENKLPPSETFQVEVVKPFHLYQYPNIMKRNARYRGHRESEKFLNNHQEQIYDLRKIFQNIDHLKNLKDTTIKSWFHGETIASMFTILKENESKSLKSKEDSKRISDNEIRAFQNDMIQLNSNSLEGRITGIYLLKKRMQELDERIAEAERRYREYENAYK